MRRLGHGEHLLPQGTGLVGVTRQVEGEVSVESPDPDSLVVEGEHVFDVRDFGVHPPRIGFLRVHPEVHVAIRVEAERAT